MEFLLITIYEIILKIARHKATDRINTNFS